MGKPKIKGTTIKKKTQTNITDRRSRILERATTSDHLAVIREDFYEKKRHKK